MEAGELLRGCVLSFVDRIDEKGIELDCDIDDADMISDEGFLEIIFNNLISNAVKFTGRGGRIAVTFKDEGDFVSVRVKDSGCGMSAETGARTFDKFYRGVTAPSQDGHVFGLAPLPRFCNTPVRCVELDS